MDGSRRLLYLSFWSIARSARHAAGSEASKAESESLILKKPS